MDAYQQYIHKSRYARYLPLEQRRETWEETVNRYVNYWVDNAGLDDFEVSEIFRSIHDLDVMPSMRALMTAGEALDRDNVAGFNCSYLPIDHPKAFDEMMYVLMCGTGVGFSVERQYISKLPEIAEEFHDTDSCIHVSDSKIGWAKAYRELIAMLYSGQLPKWDVSGVRPAGATLRTFGGRASGPEPLKSFGVLLDEGLVPSNVTISAVRLHRSSLLAVSEEVPLSVCLTLQMIESDDASQDSGG
jgi:ribonucleoside-diphosphate reductase alpha chain